MTKTTKRIPAVEPRCDPYAFAAEARRRRRVARERARSRVLVAVHLAADPTGLGVRTTLIELAGLAGMRLNAAARVLRMLARAGEVLVLKREWPDPAKLILIMDHAAAAETARLALIAGWLIDRVSEEHWSKLEAAATGGYRLVPPADSGLKPG